MIENHSIQGTPAIYSDGFGYFYDNLYRLYFTEYGKLCSLHSYKNQDNNETTPDIDKICRFIEKNLPRHKKYIHDTNSQINYIYFFEDIMVRLYKDHHSDSSSYMIFYVNYPKKLISDFESLSLKLERKKKEIGVIIQNSNGLTVYYSPLTRCDFDVDNYNDDLVQNHELIVNELNSDKNGVHLFYGLPGTGKTSYISCLTSLVDKNLIYIPNSVAVMMDSPQFLQLLMSQSNSVFIIEDAEKIIISREIDGHSPISALLNLSDGLLGQTLKSQFICTFNTNIDKIDQALLRRGRLLSSHEFLPLEEEKAKKLAKKLGREYVEGQNTLTDIYNSDIIKNNFLNKVKNKIGFK